MTEDFYTDYDYMEDQMDEPDEHQQKLMQVANCLSLFEGADFETALENACYMCDVDSDDFDEWDLQELADSYK